MSMLWMNSPDETNSQKWNKLVFYFLLLYFSQSLLEAVPLLCHKKYKQGPFMLYLAGKLPFEKYNKIHNR